MLGQGRRGPPVARTRVRYAQDKALMRAPPRRARGSGPALDRADRVAGSRRCLGRVRRRGRLAGGAQDRVTGGYDGKGVWLVDSPEAAAACSPPALALLAEARVPIARELAAVVARSPYGQGRHLAGRRDRAARRHLRGGDRAGAGPARRASPMRPSASRCGSPRNWASRGCSPSSCSRRRTARSRQRAGHASAQLGALDDRRRAHVAVRAAPARGAGLPARRYHDDRSGGGHGEPARRAGGRPTGEHRRAGPSLPGRAGRT